MHDPSSSAQFYEFSGLVPPAIPLHLLTDGAGDSRHARLHLRHAPLGRAASDLQHQLGTRRFLELLTLADWDDECTGTADYAVLVINIEVVDIHSERVRPLQHDRQAIDGDAGGMYVLSRHDDERAVVVGTVAGDGD